jgi:hypothetical protein
MPFCPWVFCGADATEPGVVGILWGRDAVSGPSEGWRIEGSSFIVDGR